MGLGDAELAIETAHDGDESRGADRRAHGRPAEGDALLAREPVAHQGCGADKTESHGNEYERCQADEVHHGARDRAEDSVQDTGYDEREAAHLTHAGLDQHAAEQDTADNGDDAGGRRETQQLVGIPAMHCREHVRIQVQAVRADT